MTVLRRATACLTLAGAVLLVATGAAVAAEGSTDQIDRRSGAGRFETVIATSQLVFEQADTIVLAVSNQPQVAALAAPVAGQLDAPLLLTSAEELTRVTGAEITRLSAMRAVVVTQAEEVSAALLDDLGALDVEVEQIADPDFGELAVDVADWLDPSDVVYLTTTLSIENWQDSVEMSPWAANDNAPILPVTPGGLTPDALQHLDDAGVRRAVIRDGRSDAAAVLGPQLRQLDISMEFATWSSVPRSYGRCGTGPVFVAGERSYPDVSTAGPVIAALCGRLAVVNPVDVEALIADVREVADARADIDETPNLIILGGTPSISNDAMRTIAEAIGIRLPVVKGYLDLRSGGGDVLALVLALGVLFIPSRRPRRGPRDDDSQ